MGDMRDKIIDLQGEKVYVEEIGDGNVGIRPSMTEAWYQKIVEVGDDYFIVEFVAVAKHIAMPDRQPITYAISAVKKITGL